MGEGSAITTLPILTIITIIITHHHPLSRIIITIHKNSCLCFFSFAASVAASAGDSAGWCQYF